MLKSIFTFLLSILLFTVFTTTSYSQLVGGNTYLINGTSSPPSSFATMKEAVNYLSANGVTGAGQVILEFSTGYTTETDTVGIRPIAGTSATLGVTFRPAAGFTVNMTFTPTSTTNSFVIRFNGAQYVTLDGRAGGASLTRDWTVEALGTNGQSAVRFENSSASTSNNTIKYLNMRANATGTTSAIFGITTGTPGKNYQNNIIEYNLIESGTTIRGYALSLGWSSTGTANTGNVLRYNIIRKFNDNGIRFTGTFPNTLIYNNEIYFSSSQTSGTALTAIYFSSPTSNNSGGVKIYNNKIYDLLTTTTGVTIRGFYQYSGSFTGDPVMFYNNFISLGNGVTSNPTIYGIEVNTATSGTPTYFYYNSVYISGSATSGTSNSAAFRRSVADVLMKLQDNIFYNARSNSGGTGVHWAISYNSTSSGTIGNNDYYVSGTGGVLGTTDGAATGNKATLALWQGAVTADAGSVSQDPYYLNPTVSADLHLNSATPSQLESGGTTISGITTDIDGDTRNASTPDIGADEYAGIGLDLTAPTISYSAFTNTSSLVDRVLSTTITDASGVPTSDAGLPVLYWKINSGSYAAVTGVFVSGSTYTFTFGSGVIAGDVVSYYVAAQDNAGTPNVTTNPSTGASGFTTNPPAASTPPTTPSSYTIIGTISGTKTVGAAGADYTNLTAAIADLNNKELTGAVTFLLNADYSSAGETFPLTINVNGGSSASNTVTIKPNTSVTATISGSSASAIFKINGADYVTIDGSNSGGTDKSLTISNTNTVASTAAIWNSSLGTGAGATYNTFKNCNLSTGSTAVITYGVIIGGATIASTGADNDYVTVQNNSISSAAVGVYALGTASVSTGGDDNLSVTENTISHNGSIASPIGIQVGNALNSSVSQNSISVITSASTQPVGISLETGFVSSTVTRNNITNVSTSATGGYGGRGLTVGTGTASSSLTIANNFISGVNGSNYSSFGNSSSMGICIGTIGGSGTLTTTAGGINLYANSVNMYGSYSYAAACLTAALYVGTGASALDIRDNIFVNSLNNTNASGTTSKNYTVYSAVANTAYTTMNYNDYYKSGTQGVMGYLTSDRTDIAGMQAGFGGNVNSITGDPVFTSSSDLHINTSGSLSPVSNVGTSIGAVTVDYDGASRSGTPDIGADEFSYPLAQAFSLIGPSGAGQQVAGNLSWDASANASGYDVYFDQNNPPTTLVSTNQAGTTWGYSGSSAATYYWNVVAKNLEGITQNSSNGPLDFTTVTPPDAPTGLTLTNVTETSMDVNWTDNATSDDSFYVYRKVGSAPSVGSPYTDRIAVVVGDTALTIAHTYNDATLSTNVKYYYRVSAINVQGESNYTEGNATTLAAVPGAPTASNILYTSMRVTLAELGNNPAGTELAVRVSGPATKYLNTSGVLVDAEVWATYASFGGANGVAVSGLAMGTSYTFEVKARNLSFVETAYGSSLVQSTLAPISSFPYTQNFDGAADPTWYSGATGGINDWVLGTPAKTQITGAHSAPNAWVTKLTGNYSNSANAAVYSPYFDFSSLTKSPFISFWHNFSFESGWEAGILEYTTDFGTSWRRVDSTLGTGGNFVTVNSANWYNSSSTSGPIVPFKFSGLSTAYTGHASGYIQSGSRLVGLEGKSAVQFRFRFGSDASFNSYEGWALDDITVARDLIPPSIVYTPLLNTTELTNRTVVAKITDAETGVQRSASGSPLLWFKKNAGAYVSTTGVEAPADTFTFTIDYSQVSGIVPGDQISYYVAAQDSADLVGVVPSGTNTTINPPNATVAAPNSYFVIASNDIKSVAVVYPTAVRVVSNVTFIPKATFRNLGVNPQLSKKLSFPVRFQILNGSNTVVYEDEQNVAALASDSSITVSFGATGSVFGTTAIDAGAYTARAIAMLAGDEITSNDVVDFAFNVANPLAGTYTIGAGGNYATLTDFLADLNVLGLSGNATAELTNYSSESEVFPITINQVGNYGGGPWTLTVKPGALQTPVITGSSANAVIKLNGADYVTIDGSNSEGGTSHDLTISNTNAVANTAAIWVASLGINAGAKNVTIKNCNISSGYIAGSTSFGIYVAGTTISSTGTGNHNHNLTIENNTISKAYNGIYVRASSGNPTNGILIKQNVIGSTDTLQAIVNRGIDIRFANAPLVTENEVFGLFTRGSINNAGIDMGDEITNGVVSKNIVHGLRSLNISDYGAYGIVLSAPSGNACNVDVINNIVYDIVSGGDPSSTTWNPMGIRIFGGLNHKIYNNSVYMTGDLTTADMSIAFIIINNTVTGCDVRNNIFANVMTGATGFKAYSVYVGTGVTFGTIDYNDYYASGPIAMFGYANGADVANLAAWKTYTGQDVHSISVDPGFVSTTDLHINANSPNVESRGTPLASVTSDFDGDVRSETLPDLGADEYDGPAPAAFTQTSPANNAINQGIAGTLTWAASTGAVAYDVFFDQNDPPTTLVSGNQAGTSYVYAGLTKGYNYYWVVVAKNNSGTETSSAFKFSTYTTPQAFTLLYPANNAVAVPNNGNLLWNASKDILKNAGVTYDVFLDVVFPPQNQIATNLSDTTEAYSGLNASTKYYWKVDAKNDLGTLASAIDSFTVESPVGEFSLTSPADSSINVSLAGQIAWSTSENATSYDVLIEGPDTVAVNGYTGTIYNYSGLEPSTVYLWTIKAKNSVSNLTASNAPFSFTTVTPPNPPTNLLVSNITNDSMDLGWSDNSSDELGFYIYRSLTGVEGSYEKVDSVLPDVVTYVGSQSRALGINIRYYWRVVAYNVNGESNFAGNDNATHAVTPNETYVDNPNPTSLRVRIASNSNPSNTEFAIRAQFNEQTKYVQDDTTLGEAPVWRKRGNWGGIVGVTVKNLTPSTNYTFDTKARNLDLVETSFGPANNATTKPAAPSNVTIDNITTSGMRLNWTDVTPDEVGFYIYRTTNPENGYALVDSVLAGVQTYNGSGLSVNTRYYWGVTAYNLIGESQMSLIDAYTLANVPLQPLVIDSTYSTIKIAIDANDGNPAGTQYAIRVGAQFVQNDGSLGESEFWNTYNGFGGVLGKVVTGLTIQSTYQVDVKAKNIANIETEFGPVRDAHTAPRPSQLLSEDFTTYTGIAPPPINWNEGNDKNILDGGVFGSPSSSQWSVDGFGNVGTTGAAKFNFYSSADWDWLVSPVINMTLPGNTSSLYFDASLTLWNTTTATTMDAGDTMYVVVSTDSGITFPRANIVKGFYASTPVPNTGANYKVSLAAFAGFTKVRIGFLVIDGASTGGDYDFFIDNVKILKDNNSDISASSIQEPAVGSVKVQNALFPLKATFTNTGVQPQSDVNVSMNIIDSVNGSIVLTSSKVIPSMDIGQSVQVTFDDGLVSDPGTYRAIAIAEHTSDEFRGNDTVKNIFKIVGETRTNLVADNGGYIFSSSASSLSPRPTYGWVDAGPNGGGTKITMADDDDAMSATIYLPRPFTFYGNTYNAIRVNTNGFLTFDTTYATGAIYEAQIPGTAAPNYLIAGFWDDLNSKVSIGVTNSGIYRKTVNNKYYVEWYKYQQYGSSGNGDTMTFQIVLDFADNSVAINYASPLDGNFLVGANDGAAGIEGDGGAGNGSSYYYTNNPVLNFPTSGSSIKFGTTIDQLNHTGSISGVKYLDADGDGVKDAGENGIADWEINISGGASASLNTNANGYYEFVNLLPGSYTVTETPVVGWVQTEPVGGSYDVTIGGSQAVTGKNFGNYKLISEIHGTKWNDLNGNGLKENGEPGLSNWEIHLNSSGAASKATIISSMKVSKKSSFSIDGIRTPTNSEQSPSIVSALGKLNGNNQILTEMVAFTDANGDYAFIDLPLGNYLISEVPQSGWVQTFPASPGIWEVAIDTFGRVQNDINFGNFAEATISGFKYLDTDADGQRDEGEIGLENWQIVLDKNGDVVNAMQTGADGSYTFSELGPGTYGVSEVQQNGWVQTEPVAMTYSVSVSSGVVEADKNFGNYHIGSISGVKYEDINGNGTRDEGEPGLENWTINLNIGNNTNDATTNANGEYSFENLIPGSYTVTEELQATYFQSEPQSGSYVVVHDGDGTNDDFIGNFGNYRLGSITGMNFLDADGNGVKDDGEVGLEGWEITVEQNSIVISTDTTDADGNYSFANLVPGDYTVSEILPLGYIQTYPQSGSYSISLESGNAITGKDFGNRVTTPGEFVGRVDSLWSNPLNWGYGTLPGGNVDVVVPVGVRLVIDDVGESDSIKSLTSRGVLRISSDLTLKIAGEVTGTGSVSVDADATPTLVVYGSWSIAGFSKGMSTIAFAGPAEKLIIGASGVPFYNVRIGGSNTTLDGSMSVDNSLSLDGNLTTAVGDTIRINNEQLEALSGTGSVSNGTIIRMIAAGESGNYRWHTANSYIAFATGKGNTNPTSLKITRIPVDTMPDGINQAFKGGTVNTTANTVTLSGVTKFSRWAFGQVGHKEGEVGPLYEIEEDATEKDGASFSATLSLEYDESTLGGIPEGSLGFYKSANTIVVQKVVDSDNNFNTTNDRTAKTWGLTVGSQTANDTMLTVEDVGSGTFSVSEADSGSMWIRMGIVVNGVGTAGTGSVTNVTFTGEEGQLTTVVFVNSRLDTMKFRTFKESTTLSAKIVSLKYKAGKGTTPPTVSGTPNEVTVVENVFKRAIGKSGTTFLGIPQTDKTLAKQYGWLFYKGSSTLGKMFTEAHTGISAPIDSLRIIGKKSKKLAKGITADRKKYNNPAWAQGILLRLNIIASDTGITPKGFGDLVIDTIGTLAGTSVKGMSVRNMAKLYDTCMTYWQSKGIDSSSDYVLLAQFVDNIIAPLNNRFYFPMTTLNDDYTLDSVQLALKNPYAVNLAGYKTASEIGGIVKNMGAKSNVQFVPVSGYIEQMAEKFALNQNYPNPFNPSTEINFSLLEDAIVSLKIYDVLGREVVTLLNNEQFVAGDESVTFDAANIPSGVYFYRIHIQTLNSGTEYVQTKKMMLMK